MSDRVQYVSIGKIKIKDRSREDFGDMQGLIESIKDKGIIVPLIVNKKLELKAGGRRYDAALQAGLKQVPCLIRDNADELDGLEIELIENVFRKDFTWLEYSAHIKKLHDYCSVRKIDWSGRKTAQLIGEPTKNISRALVLAQAVIDMPELAKVKTQDEAEKVIKRLHEHVAVGELRRRQDEQTKDRGLLSTMKIAKANYCIGDCFMGMAELRSNGVIHFIELDPPYGTDLDILKGGAGQRARAGFKSGDAKSLVDNYNEISTDKYESFISRMAKETFRVAHHHAWMICWFGPTNFQLVKISLQDAGWSVCDIPGIWVKPAGQTLAPEYNLANCYEPFFICRKGRPALIKRGRSNVFQYNPVPAQTKYHTTQRPLDLMADILETFTIPMQICLVPCIGSGVTLRACYLYGVNVFGYEISDKYRDKFLLAVEDDTKKLDEKE